MVVKKARLAVGTDAESSCPNEDELAQFLGRSLPWTKARAVEAHFDECHDCRRLTFALASVELSSKLR